MSVDLELTPKTKRPAGEPCCEPVVYPEVQREQAKGATQKLRGRGPLADEVAFRFKLSLPATVKINLAHLLRGHARESWRELAKDARAFTASAGTSRDHLNARNRLGTGTYRLTLLIPGGGSRSIVFTVG